MAPDPSAALLAARFQLRRHPLPGAPECNHSRHDPVDAGESPAIEPLKHGSENEREPVHDE